MGHLGCTGTLLCRPHRRPQQGKGLLIELLQRLAFAQKLYQRFTGRFFVAPMQMNPYDINDGIVMPSALAVLRLITSSQSTAVASLAIFDLASLAATRAPMTISGGFMTLKADLALDGAIGNQPLRSVTAEERAIYASLGVVKLSQIDPPNRLNRLREPLDDVFSQSAERMQESRLGFGGDSVRGASADVAAVVSLRKRDAPDADSPPLTFRRHSLLILSLPTLLSQSEAPGNGSSVLRA